MADRRGTRWEITPHTRAKHLILQRYLEAWLPILASQHGRIIYVDGFAGPGRYTGGEPGSPLIALATLLDHPRFQGTTHGRHVTCLFIEREADRAEALREELARFRELRPIPGWVAVNVVHGEFAPTMTAVLDDLEQAGRRLAPTFCFIDPFGPAGVPLALIQRIAKNPRCECLINFAYDAVWRFKEHPNPEILAHPDALFGTEEWQRALTLPDPEQQREFIINLYRQQLQHVAGFDHVRTFEMINEGNRTAYFLYFGTHDRKGLSAMKIAMWSADLVGGQAFSDRTLGGDQTVLFEPSPDLAALKAALQRQFRGDHLVSIEDVEDFVLFETPYSEVKHLKERTLAPMERAKPPEIRAYGGGTKPRRTYTYPAGTKIRFL